MTGCDELLRPAILDHFSSSISISDDNGDCLIRFPFVKPDGDEVRLWILDQGDDYLITDEGETYGTLFLSGINIETESREERIQVAKRRFGLDTAKYEVSKTADEADLGQAIFDVYEGVQRIASLEYTRRPYPQDDFRSEVAGYLDEHGYKFEPHATVQGYAEPQTVDFQFYNLSQPTYMEAIRATDDSDLHNKCEDTSYRWYQIGRVQNDSRFVTVVDDIEGVYNEDQMKPVFAEAGEVVAWRQKSQLERILV